MRADATVRNPAPRGRTETAQLVLSFLGTFEALLDGRPVDNFHYDKVRALLAYLAVESDRPHRRDSLVGLLCPDWPDRAACTNLRNALANLRTAISDRIVAPQLLPGCPRRLGRWARPRRG